MLRGLIEGIESRKKDSQTENASLAPSAQSTQLPAKRVLPSQSPILSSSPLLSQQLHNLTVSPMRKSVKFDSKPTQYNFSEDDEDLSALLKDFDHEIKPEDFKAEHARESEANESAVKESKSFEQAANQSKTSKEAVSQAVLDNQSFDSDMLFSGNDSIFESSTAANATMQTIDPGASVSQHQSSYFENTNVNKAEFTAGFREILDEPDYEILSLTSHSFSEQQMTRFVPQQMTAETFSIDQLVYNIQNIDPKLDLHPLNSIFSEEGVRRLKGPAALMVQRIRNVGPTLQLNLMDGSGNEITGTLPLSSFSDIKFHYGMICILKDVRYNSSCVDHNSYYLGRYLFATARSEILEYNREKCFKCIRERAQNKLKDNY